MAGTPTPPAPARRPVRRAWILALAADLVQWVLFPIFSQGAASPAADALDVVVAALLVRWLGWHWAFLPAFAVELLPGVDLVPTWTLAVWIATRGREPAAPATTV